MDRLLFARSLCVVAALDRVAMERQRGCAIVTAVCGAVASVPRRRAGEAPLVDERVRKADVCETKGRGGCCGRRCENGVVELCVCGAAQRAVLIRKRAAAQLSLVATMGRLGCLFQNSQGARGRIQAQSLAFPWDERAAKKHERRVAFGLALAALEGSTLCQPSAEILWCFPSSVCIVVWHASRWWWSSWLALPKRFLRETGAPITGLGRFRGPKEGQEGTLLGEIEWREKFRREERERPEWGAREAEAIFKLWASCSLGTALGARLSLADHAFRRRPRRGRVGRTALTGSRRYCSAATTEGVEVEDVPARQPQSVAPQQLQTRHAVVHVPLIFPQDAVYRDACPGNKGSTKGSLASR